MKRILFILVAISIANGIVNAQTIEELKAEKAELATEASAKKAELAELQGKIKSIDSEIEKLSGWITGFAGNIGFDFNQSNNWVSSPNPDATSTGLAIGLTGYANKMTDKTMWRNKAIANKAWQDINIGDNDNGGLFDNGTVDILNLSSLYGYRVHPKFAISALGELNSSIENFLKPGALDLGVGGTWTPSNNLVVVVHPLNYHVAWPADGTGVESTGALGAKIRADYTNKYVIAGKDVAFSSTLTSFLPYSNDKTVFNEGTENEYEAGLFEYTWVNNFSFELWRGIGVGAGFGFRGADFESLDPQSYYTFGLSYSL